MENREPKDLFTYTFYCDYHKKRVDRNFCIRLCKVPYMDECFTATVAREIKKEYPNTNFHLLKNRINKILPFK